MGAKRGNTDKKQALSKGVIEHILQKRHNSPYELLCEHISIIEL